MSRPLRLELSGGLYHVTSPHEVIDVRIDLKNQIFLASDVFINKNLKLINKMQSLNDVPTLQRSKIAKPLDCYDNKYKDSKIAISQAYKSGRYAL